jgi:hypothetical protein
MKAQRFTKPTDQQMVEMAILFNDGKMDLDKLADMMAYAQCLIDRLYENGNVTIPSSFEKP